MATNKIKGLGDVIAAVTTAVGIKPCAGCEERRQLLNRNPFKKTNKLEIDDCTLIAGVDTMNDEELIALYNRLFFSDLIDLQPNVKVAVVRDLKLLCID